MSRYPVAIVTLCAIALLAGCATQATPLPVASALNPVTPQPTPEPPAATPLLPTWTPAARPTERSSATPLPSPLPTHKPSPSPSCSPTWAPTVRPSATPSPVSSPVTPPPTPAPLPPGTANLLPNPSFEEGWYNLNGIPELQLPSRWAFEWEEGTNPLDPDPWNVFVRPETRVLSREYLPADEHELYIWDGDYTVKIFKGSGAISVRLWTTTYLEPGRYRFQVQVFPDLVVDYVEGQKVWAPDPLSGEVRLYTSAGTAEWMLPIFGARNTFGYEFALEQGAMTELGVALRGRWAIMNNGWFVDDWSLVRRPD